MGDVESADSQSGDHDWVWANGVSSNTDTLCIVVIACPRTLGELKGSPDILTTSMAHPSLCLDLNVRDVLGDPKISTRRLRCEVVGMAVLSTL